MRSSNEADTIKHQDSRIVVDVSLAPLTKYAMQQSVVCFLRLPGETDEKRPFLQYDSVRRGHTAHMAAEYAAHERMVHAVVT